jgi:hypothetical protein
MPLSPHIIKHPIDDEEYATACPTIGTLMLARFSTPERHETIIYRADNQFFEANPSRRVYLRLAIRNEWDVYTTEDEFKARPSLWVSVHQTSQGHHEIIPRWRGRAEWSDLKSDEAVVEAIRQMSQRGGLNLSEWHSFVCDQRVRKNDAARKAKRSKKSMVN